MKFFFLDQSSLYKMIFILHFVGNFDVFVLADIWVGVVFFGSKMGGGGKGWGGWEKRKNQRFFAEKKKKKKEKIGLILYFNGF